MRVLVLRPDDGARRTAARLAALGHEAICAPLIDTLATAEAPPAGALEGAFEAVAATSAQAFRLADAQTLARLASLPTMCVGARTVDAARQAGFARIAVEAPDAASLVARLAARLLDHPGAPRRLLYLAGRERKPDLETGLAAAGYSVTPWIVYEARARTELPDQASAALRAGAVDAALHFSRRSAAIFCDLAKRAGLAAQARAVLHVAISPDAAAGLDALGPSRVRVAAAPDEAHMLAQIA